LILILKTMIQLISRETKTIWMFFNSLILICVVLWCSGSYKGSASNDPFKHTTNRFRSHQVMLAEWSSIASDLCPNFAKIRTSQERIWNQSWEMEFSPSDPKETNLELTTVRTQHKSKFLILKPCKFNLSIVNKQSHEEVQHKIHNKISLFIEHKLLSVVNFIEVYKWCIE
jgi:hypothetical protein